MAKRLAENAQAFLASLPLSLLCTPGMSKIPSCGGVNLCDSSPLHVNPVNMLNMLTKILAKEQVFRSRYCEGHCREALSEACLPLDGKPECKPMRQAWEY
ncbi:MAG: hypothetical protein JW920_12315 [Deltaproteobacteria bacterium]|nr:hypothetical protein [Deltaproteobacteria bacterium]